MQEFRDALAEGYGKELGKVVASWMHDAGTPTGDIRNVARNHVPNTLFQFLAPKKLLPAFTEAREKYDFMSILNSQYDKVIAKIEAAEDSIEAEALLLLNQTDQSSQRSASDVTTANDGSAG